LINQESNQCNLIDQFEQNNNDNNHEPKLIRKNKDNNQPCSNKLKSNKSLGVINLSAKNSDDRNKGSLSEKLKKVYSQQSINPKDLYKFEHPSKKKLKIKSSERSERSIINDPQSLISPKHSDSLRQNIQNKNSKQNKSPDSENQKN